KKGKFGANANLCVTIAVQRAVAVLLGQPLYKYLGGFNGQHLPVPMMYLVNGGSHSDSPIAFQDFIILPVGAPTFTESLRWGPEIFHTLTSILSNRGLEPA
ncbi:enolase, partial [Staphylococcus aureus]